MLASTISNFFRGHQWIKSDKNVQKLCINQQRLTEGSHHVTLPGVPRHPGGGGEGGGGEDEGELGQHGDGAGGGTLLARARPATVYIDYTNTRHAQTRETRGSKEQYCNYHNSGSVFSAD